MILAELRDYLRQRGQATLADLANHFDAEPEALRGMLEVWIRKGRVQRQMATASCGTSCSHCDPHTTEIYVWSERKAPAVPVLPAHCEH